MYKCLLWDEKSSYFGSCVQNLILPFILTLIIFGLTVYTFFSSNRNENRRNYIRRNHYALITFITSQLLSILANGICLGFQISEKNTNFESSLSSLLFGLSSAFQLFLYLWAVRHIIVSYKYLIVTSAIYMLVSFNPLQNSIQKLLYNESLDAFNYVSFFVSAFSIIAFITSFFTKQSDVPFDHHLLSENSHAFDEVPPPELKANLFSLITFSWMSPIIKLGYKRSLTFTDLKPLHPKEESQVLFDELKAQWDKEMALKPPGKRSLIRVLAKLHWKTFVVGSSMKVIYDILLFSGPLFLKVIISFFEDTNSSNSQTNEYMGFIYTGLLLLSFMTQTIFLHQYFHRMIRVGMRMKSALTSMIYDTSMRIPQGMAGKIKPDGTLLDVEPKSTGEIVNLMAVDTQRVQDLMTYVQIVWSGPFQILVSMILLYNNIGISTFGGIAVAFLMIPISGYITKTIKKVQNVVMKKRDDRLKITNETLNGIRILKMLAWENSFTEKIMDQRSIELDHLWKYQVVSALSRMQWTLAPVMILLVSFTIYVLIGNVLTAPIAFTTLALVNILRFPMQLVPVMINNLIEALISLNRIQEFLEIPPLKPLMINYISPPSEPLIKIRNADFSWFNKMPLLKNINLDINKGELVAIIGSTGSGKSGLLHSIIGDTEKTCGDLNINGGISYCAQVPWVQNCSVKDNITFKKPYNDYFYHKVVNACALKPDFDVLPAGDETEIGERGINLSGGQKQRIAMARAIYHSANIYIFDDCFSALDANVSKFVFKKCFQEILREQTVLLVTHKLDLLPFCDRILVVQNNEIVYNGQFAGLQYTSVYQEFSASQGTQDADSSLSELTLPTEVDTISQESISPSITNPGSDDESQYEKTPFERRNSNEMKDEPTRDPSKDDTQTKNKEKKDIGSLISIEQVQHGKVASSVYWQYIKNASFVTFSFYIGCQIFTNASQMGSTFWLSYWSAEPEMVSSAAGLSMYGIISITQVFLAICSLIYMAIAIQNAAEKFHSGLITGIMKAPLSFFDTTPLGRIVNRFAKDTNVIDEELPANLTSYVTTILNIVVIVLSISFAVPLFLIPMAALCAVYYYFQLYYIPTSRQLQRLDSVLRSPLFANFTETLDGIPTIRAFKYEDKFLKYNQHLVDANLRAYYLRVASNRWLAIRLESVGTGIVVSTALLCVISMGRISPSLAGLAISYSLNITQSLTNLVRVAGTLESSIVSVERIKEYTTDIPQEKTQKVNIKHVKWPKNGSIKFVDYSLRYRPELPLVLKDLNFSIKGGDKVGIVGRTGAGKSSLMTALLRLTEPAKGYVEIDGESTQNVNLKLLRSKFCIIPQSPTLFSGTLRFNVDPLNQSTDQQVMDALEKAHIKSYMQTISDDPLSYIVDENGRNFSVGQRQMICLARAIISNAVIVMLDEATSVVDPHTDQLIQQTIKQEFAASTILTIAHRINTILNSDKILVLDHGQISEFDSPQALFSNKESIFRSLCLQSGINLVNGEFTYDSTQEFIKQ